MKRLLSYYTPLLATVLLAGLLPGLNSSARAQIVDISIVDFTFVPDNVVVDAGTIVRWTNNDAVAHTSTAIGGLWDSGSLGAGESFSVALPLPGDYSYICTFHPFMTGTITVQQPTDVEEPGNDQLPGSFDVQQNYPNPFNPSTTIPYSLPHASRVQVKVYNVLGRLVATILDSSQPPGDYAVEWDGTDDSGVEVASGIYLYRISTGDAAITRKMILLK